VTTHWWDLSRLFRMRNGRRRALIGLIGTIWSGYGWAIYSSPLRGFQFGRLGPGPIEWALTLPWSGILWVVCGAAGIVAAVFRRIPDGYGFNSLLVPPLLWTFLYAWSWMIWIVTNGDYGSARSWVSALIWLCAVVALAVTSGWPDPTDQDG
jgi:hypothetical protein